MENMKGELDLSYIDKMSKEEIVKHLTNLPLIDLRVRLKAFESAKRKMVANHKERLKSDREYADRFKTKRN